ncbi:hypothetical protein GLAREA_01946 [Glarea lozoyensis ATCC 20868]|uniref:Uncharacterized protein n=1 Tax=Glarea lozoyensis (strain ATCC 20868 / MF5171) TaxID=1116229 RepID=S3CLD7_GLAL2|nr:uncharacterized protein GLAREA_01946 [Glarea lozoyensis ATCC 20868]EPE26034.1 hypothetical protein GLAREA_01946 [Glarea lozoyensis ATCC 20868]
MLDSFSQRDAHRRVEELMLNRPTEEDLLRSNSDRKWKKILGFDDGSFVKPRVYSDLPEVVTKPVLATKRSHSSLSQHIASYRRKGGDVSPSVYSDLPEVVTGQFLASKPSYSSLPQDTTSYWQNIGDISPSAYSDLPEVVTEPILASMSSYPRLPRDITFYRKNGDDFALSPSPPAPSPNDVKPLPSPPHLLYISVGSDPSPFEFDHRPDILLHTGPSKSSPVLSYVEYQAGSEKADITICPCGSTVTPTYRTISLPNSPTISTDSSNSNVPRLRTEQLSPTGGMFTAERFSFSHTLPNSFVRERFEWRYSTGPFIRTSSGTKESGGMKLVRISTGATVAVYAGLGASSKHMTGKSKVLGMFRFLNAAGMTNLGEEFDFLAVMSILSVVEKSRRNLVAQKAAFGIRN